MISVLVVDDNHSFVDSLKVILKEVPAIQNIKAVANFHKAEAELKKNSDYHLYIFENDAEVATKGIEFIRNMRKNNPDLKSHQFILLSTRPQELQEKAKADAIKLVRKPLMISEFKEHINRLIEQGLIGDKSV